MHTCPVEIDRQRSATGGDCELEVQGSETETPIPDGIGRRESLSSASAAGPSRAHPAAPGLLALRPRLTTGLPLSTIAPLSGATQKR